MIRAGLLLLLLLLPACDREDREPRPDQAAAEQPDAVALSPLKPGAADPPPAAPMGEKYERSAWHVSEGKRLYTWFNCVGCHAHGGGGMGPPLIDDEWLYGYEPQQVYATILQGRPNGMPAFMGKIPDFQVWELAAYVRSMSGLVPSSAAPGRNDDMKGPPPENSAKPTPPKNTRIPS